MNVLQNAQSSWAWQMLACACEYESFFWQGFKYKKICTYKNFELGYMADIQV